MEFELLSRIRAKQCEWMERFAYLKDNERRLIAGSRDRIVASMALLARTRPKLPLAGRAGFTPL